MSQNWYLSRDGRTFGPFPVEQLQAMARDGRLAATDFVAVEGASQWLQADAVDGLFPRFPAAAPTVPTQVTTPAKRGATQEKIPGRYRACPRCGSKRSRQHNPLGTDFFAIVYDRKCQDCDTIYSPPIPAWAPYGLVFAGLALISVGSWFMYILIDEFGKLRPGETKPNFGKGLLGLGAVIAFGFGLLVRAGKAWKNPDA